VLGTTCNACYTGYTLDGAADPNTCTVIAATATGVTPVVCA